METPDPLLERVSPVLAAVPGVVALALGGSRASGAAQLSSDYDLGLYFREGVGLDVGRLLGAAKGLVDDPRAAAVTEVGDWGPWIVGGAWLSIGGKKVDLLYRPIESVEKIIYDCRDGRVSVDYQPGHPHGFCSAIWMGEVALCQPLRDPDSVVAGLKALTVPYPTKLRDALVRRFHWEAAFSIENAQSAVPRDDQTYIAGCTFRSLSCVAQVIFALNRRYLINEKGALNTAARLPLTISRLSQRASGVWRAVGRRAFDAALAELGAIDNELARLTAAAL
jgi:hypothetical protein